MVEEAGIGPELVAEPELLQVLPCQASDSALGDADRLGAILLVVAYHDDPPSEQEQREGVDACLRCLVDDDSAEQPRFGLHHVPEPVQRHHPGRNARDAFHEVSTGGSPVAIRVLPGALADPADCLRPCGQALHRLLVQTLEERAPCPDGDQFLGRLLDSSLKAMELPDAFLAGGRIRDLLHPYMGARPRPGFFDCTHPVRPPRVACGLSQQSPQIGTRAVQLLDKDVVRSGSVSVRSSSSGCTQSATVSGTGGRIGVRFLRTSSHSSP